MRDEHLGTTFPHSTPILMGPTSFLTFHQCLTCGMRAHHLHSHPHISLHIHEVSRRSHLTLCPSTHSPPPHHKLPPPSHPFRSPPCPHTSPLCPQPIPYTRSLSTISPPFILIQPTSLPSSPCYKTPLKVVIKGPRKKKPKK